MKWVSQVISLSEVERACFINAIKSVSTPPAMSCQVGLVFFINTVSRHQWRKSESLEWHVTCSFTPSWLFWRLCTYFGDLDHRLLSIEYICWIFGLTVPLSFSLSVEGILHPRSLVHSSQVGDYMGSLLAQGTAAMPSMECFGDGGCSSGGWVPVLSAEGPRLIPWHF